MIVLAHVARTASRFGAGLILSSQHLDRLQVHIFTVTLVDLTRTRIHSSRSRDTAACALFDTFESIKGRRVPPFIRHNYTLSLRVRDEDRQPLAIPLTTSIPYNHEPRDFAPPPTASSTASSTASQFFGRPCLSRPIPQRMMPCSMSLRPRSSTIARA